METIKTAVTTKKLGKGIDLLSDSTHHKTVQQAEMPSDHFEMQGKKFSAKAN